MYSGHKPIDTIADMQKQLQQCKHLTLKFVVFTFFYTFIIIWFTLMMIRSDVSAQLTKSYEIQNQHIQELQECHQALGLQYESN